MHKFAFIIHPRNLQDVYRKYPIFRYLPTFMQDAVLRVLPPLRVGNIRIHGNIAGYFIAVSMTPKQMLGDRARARKKILSAIRLAENLGVKLVGLGALTSSVTHGGEDLIGKTTLAITNGNSLTAAVVVKSSTALIQKRGWRIKDIRVAIVGATGSIGSSVSFLLAEKGVRQFVLIGKTKKHLRELKTKMLTHYPDSATLTSTDIMNIASAELVVVATSSVDAIIQPKHLQKNAIVYDITQPQNVTKEVRDARKDVLVVDGGLITIPGMQYNLDLGIAEDTCFACLGETAILAMENKIKNYSIGDVDPSAAEEIWKLAQKKGVTLAPFRSFGKLIKT